MTTRNTMHRYIPVHSTEEALEHLAAVEEMGKEAFIVWHEDTDAVVVSIEYEIDHPSGLVEVEVFNEEASAEVAEIESGEFAARTGRFA